MLKLRLVFVLAALIVAPSTARAEGRVALVIGNGAYAHAVPLPNPPKDADAVGAALRRLGFEHVTVLKDLGAEALRRALLNFEPTVTGSNIAVVYFAGHGIEIDGQNFLIPTDARLTRAAAAELEAIPLSTVTTAISGARQLRLVILDACRTNPFRARMAADAGARKRSIGRGLSRIEPGENELIAFAAAAGTEADDGVGLQSPFTAALLKHIETPGLEVRLLFGGVRDEVMAATKRQQTPHVYATLGREPIFLKAGDPGSSTVVDGASLKRLQDGYAKWYALAQPVRGESEQAYIARMKQLVALAQHRPEPHWVRGHWAIGVWHGDVKAVKLGADGLARALNVANVKNDGSVFGGWSASSSRAFGLGAEISVQEDRINVRTQHFSIVTLQKSGNDRLVGTFKLKNGKTYPIALVRK